MHVNVSLTVISIKWDIFLPSVCNSFPISLQINFFFLKPLFHNFDCQNGKWASWRRPFAEVSYHFFVIIHTDTSLSVKALDAHGSTINLPKNRFYFRKGNRIKLLHLCYMYTKISLYLWKITRERSNELYLSINKSSSNWYGKIDFKK